MKNNSCCDMGNSAGQSVPVTNPTQLHEFPASHLAFKKVIVEGCFEKLDVMTSEGSVERLLKPCLWV